MTTNFKDQQWVCDSRAYHALLAQGYITHVIETRHGVRWRLMVLPWKYRQQQALPL